MSLVLNNQALNSQYNMASEGNLTLKAPNKIAADILIFYFYLSK